MIRRTTRFLKGDLTAVVLHDCNPQHGAPYNNHDRAMRDEEFQAFLTSVKGWTVLDSGAIHRTFEFASYKLAYEWMGRLFAYAYVSDKYPKLHWKGTSIEVTIYSGRFHGITRREARLAAFMNDHFNLLRKAFAAQKEHLESSKEANFFKDGVTPLIKELESRRTASSSATPPGAAAAGTTTKGEFASLNNNGDPSLDKNAWMNDPVISKASRVSHEFSSDSYAMDVLSREAKASKKKQEEN